MFGAGLVQSSGAAPAAQAVAGAPGSQVTVWVLQDGHPAPRRIVIGLSDAKNVEITGGELRPGDPVIIAQRRGAAGKSAQAGGAAGGASASGGAASGGTASGATPNGGPSSGAPTAGTPRTNRQGAGAVPGQAQ
jgi:hypothetical protein